MFWLAVYKNQRKSAQSVLSALLFPASASPQAHDGNQAKKQAAANTQDKQANLLHD
jgi:hypothetical protein